MDTVANVNPDAFLAEPFHARTVCQKTGIRFAREKSRIPDGLSRQAVLKGCKEIVANPDYQSREMVVDAARRSQLHRLDGDRNVFPVRRAGGRQAVERNHPCGVCFSPHLCAGDPEGY